MDLESLQKQECRDYPSQDQNVGPPVARVAQRQQGRRGHCQPSDYPQGQSQPPNAELLNLVSEGGSVDVLDGERQAARVARHVYLGLYAIQKGAIVQQ